MKKRPPVHPKLYTDFTINSEYVIYKYLHNSLDDQNRRILKSERKKIDLHSNYQDVLYEKNKQEYNKLEKYIKIQKKALEKHQKARNYDSCKVVESSILFMKQFKFEFKNWFNRRKYDYEF